MPPCLAIVVPCYNEEAVLPISNKLFGDEIRHLIDLELVSANSFVLYVDDGSTDSTWGMISDFAKNESSLIKGLKLSRNRGHQNALLAGLMEAKGLSCDVAISIDCDGQDDVCVMEQMVREYLSGFDIVYGVRASRKTDSFFKRTTAQLFYKLLESMGIESVYNHADYRLMSKRALEALSLFREVNLFLRGMVPLVGFPSTSVYYERHERMAGESHYPLGKMVSLAVDGITSLSIKPIRLITYLGLFVSVASFIGVLWAIVSALCGQTVSGWASTVCVVCFLGGAQILGTGVIGEYVGRIYLEVKQRPRYIISDRTYGI